MLHIGERMLIGYEALPKDFQARRLHRKRKTFQAFFLEEARWVPDNAASEKNDPEAKGCSIAPLR